MIKKNLPLILILFSLTLTFGVFAQNPSTKIGRLKYKGGGDWYANPTSLPNLISFVNKNLGTDISREEEIVEVGSMELFNYPLIHMTGHGNVVFSLEEARNLNLYLTGGGFLHIDDNYGMDKFIRPELKKVFPDLDLVELPYDHPIYHQTYDFTSGPPKIHEHDGNPSQGYGIIYKGRLVLFYTVESDLGDGWEDQEVHNDPQDVREKALKMGANMIEYVFREN